MRSVYLQPLVDLQGGDDSRVEERCFSAPEGAYRSTTRWAMMSDELTLFSLPAEEECFVITLERPGAGIGILVRLLEHVA